MSVEIRIPTDPHRHLECDWGVFDNAEADPRYELKHLVLTTSDYVAQLLEVGPRPGPRGGVHSVTTDGLRLFAHMDYGGKRTTWELFEAHFDDGLGPEDALVGRWPD